MRDALDRVEAKQARLAFECMRLAHELGRDLGIATLFERYPRKVQPADPLRSGLPECSVAAAVRTIYLVRHAELPGIGTRLLSARFRSGTTTRGLARAP